MCHLFNWDISKLLAVENALDERNTEPRGFPPSYAATADAGLVKHKIE